MENKTGKYFKYVIGEIVLVVIGILIALQINTWNENRNTYNLSKTHLKNIKKDLAADTITFRSGIKRLQNSLSIHESLFNGDIFNKLTVDSILKSIDISFHSVRIYKINNSTFSKLTNSGFLESKFFSNIFLDINDYYTREYNTWLEYLEWDKETKNRVFGPETFKEWYDNVDFIDLEKNTKLETVTNKKKEYSHIIKEYIKSSRFRNYAWNSHKEMKVILERMKYQKRIASEMIEKINAELRK
ncbi:DUF6090 family protein [Aegicerativicinus sediminis]|uniref:DUF6090 family protein n=1 Tax=Aegicerativicinus sediminis TaxID=2893202 RepID=UPI00293BD92D|nr:DUF6090 family protein [Aegicerativicinus sediminis]